jgi:arsenite methyltransferase
MGMLYVLESTIDQRAARLREAVREAYSAAAVAPGAGHPFPVGRALAESLAYPPEDLAALPTIAIDAFAGVSNVSVFSHLLPDMRVLDLGCGAGLDSLIACRRVGPRGVVLGVDFSAEMLKRARQATLLCRADNIGFCQAAGENLPVKQGGIDVAMVNGIFNLNPAREKIFRELARVVREGGSVYAAELVLREPLPPAARGRDENWFA